jgi:hypothetical protein
LIYDKLYYYKIEVPAGPKIFYHVGTNEKIGTTLDICRLLVSTKGISSSKAHKYVCKIGTLEKVEDAKRRVNKKESKLSV